MTSSLSIFSLWSGIPCADVHFRSDESSHFDSDRAHAWIRVPYVHDASLFDFRIVTVKLGRPVSYTSRQLGVHKKDKPVHGLEIGAVVFTARTSRHYPWRRLTMMSPTTKTLLVASHSVIRI